MSLGVLFDTHCHLDAPPLTDLDAVKRDARAHGVSRLLGIGVSPKTWPHMLALAHDPCIDVALGIHPQVLPELDPLEIDEGLSALAHLAKSGRVLAIGECGLDKNTARDAPGRAAMPEQLRVLDAHVEIARSTDLPLVLHVVDAHGAALAAVARHPRLARGGVVHAWSGSAELAARWVALGFRIAIGPVLTFPGSRRAKESARSVPLSSLVLETDAPYSYPSGATDADGAPRRHGLISDLTVVLAALATTLGLPGDVVADATTRNAERLFGAKRPITL